jgi:membrane-bound lytic murein transglycosylase D
MPEHARSPLRNVCPAAVLSRLRGGLCAAAFALLPGAAPGQAPAQPAPGLGVEAPGEAGAAPAPSPAPAPPELIDTWSEFRPESDRVALPPAATGDPIGDLLQGEVALPEKPDPGSVWDRIRAGFAMPDLATRRAEDRTRWYAAQADYIDRMALRASRYLFHIVEEIDRRGMPMELALLPFVESAMQPEAVSSAKAAGLWQFIPSTGRIYALEQNLWLDARRDVVESTRAALDYLQKLHDEFGHWHLALAAYNMGEGGLARAIERNRRAGRSTEYSSLPIPRETQDYVPKLQAIKNIVRDPQRYGIALPEIRNEPYFVAVSKSRDIDVETAARLAQMPLEEFRALNPAFNRPVIVGAAQPTLLLPADRAGTFAANVAAYEATGQPLARWTTYTLRGAETLEQVAARVGVSAAHLREANRVPPRYRLAAGSTILVPRDQTQGEDIAPEHLDAAFRLVPAHANLQQITYRVRAGDTLAGVARRWNVQPEEIVAWNHLRSDRLFAGQRLSLTVARPARSAPQSAQQRRATAAGAAVAGGAARAASAAAR